jgi:hypothetical protein
MSNTKARLGPWLILAVTLAVLPAGCGGGKSFTPEDFKKVTSGTPEAKVVEILGSPAESLTAGDVKRSFWSVGDKYYSISIKDGKVVEPLGPTSKVEYDMMRELMKFKPK